MHPASPHRLDCRPELSPLRGAAVMRVPTSVTSLQRGGKHALRRKINRWRTWGWGPQCPEALEHFWTEILHWPALWKKTKTNQNTTPPSLVWFLFLHTKWLLSNLITNPSNHSPNAWSSTFLSFKLLFSQKYPLFNQKYPRSYTSLWPTYYRASCSLSERASDFACLYFKF